MPYPRKLPLFGTPTVTSIAPSIFDILEEPGSPKALDLYGEEQCVNAKGALFLMKGEGKTFRVLHRTPEGGVCGGARVIGGLPDRSPKGVGVLVTLLVSPEHRREGVATRIVDFARDEWPKLKVDATMSHYGAAFFGVDVPPPATLYHFTSLDNAWVLLNDRELKNLNDRDEFHAASGGFVLSRARPGVSLTSNPFLIATENAGGENRPWAECRITLSTTALLDSGSKPEMYIDNDNHVVAEDRQEEWLIRSKSVSIDGAVLGVDLIQEEYLHNEAKRSICLDYDDARGMDQERIDYMAGFVEWCKDTGIPLRVVPNFEASSPAALQPSAAASLPMPQHCVLETASSNIPRL